LEKPVVSPAEGRCEVYISAGGIHERKTGEWGIIGRRTHVSGRKNRHYHKKIIQFFVDFFKKLRII